MWLAAILPLVFMSLEAVAQDAYVRLEQRLTAEQMRETGLDHLTPAQLERLNQLLSDGARQDGSSTPPSAGAAAQGAASLIGFNDEPIHDRLTGTISGWEPGTVFRLENGQQWKVLKGKMSLKKPLSSPEIVVVPGIAGRWFLQVHEDLPKARVYRID